MGDVATVDNKIYDNVSGVRQITSFANNNVELLKYDGNKEVINHIAAPSSKITTGPNRISHEDNIYTQYGVCVIDNVPCKMSVIIQIGDEFIVNGVRVNDPNIADINYSLDCHYHVEVTMKDGTTTFKDTFAPTSAAPFATMDIKPDVTTLERICEDAWDKAVFAINRGNLIPAKWLTMYYGDGKYYDGELNLIKNRKINFPVENYYIDEISHITISEHNFCLEGLRPILSKLAADLINVEFTHEWPYNLMFALKDNTKIKGCVNVNEIMFEDGRTFEVIPSDGIYYSNCGVYERFNNFNKIAPNMYELNGSIYAFRSHSPRSIIVDGENEIYSCGDSYIMKFGKYFLFGKRVL